MKKNKNKIKTYPFVSICTPTFNRRPFIPMIIKCFENQTYPKDKMEWIIVDDGTDKIEDLVKHIPQVKYFKYDEKLTLGKKRNITNEKSKGEIIVYMDDDDYYPHDRVKHAVDTLMSSKALCAGSSGMFIYFKHINKMYLFGPYNDNHATAATFAFKRELLSQTKFSEDSSVAEEKKFLKDYTIPFVQLDSRKSILVFSHIHNSFDKKELLQQMPNPNIHDTIVLPGDIVKEPDILKFFMEDIDKLLNNYKLGNPENKPDVIKQLATIKKEREKLIEEHIKKQNEYQNTMNKMNTLITPQNIQHQLNEQTNIIQQLMYENNKLKEQVEYLENKIKEFITNQIQKNKEQKNKEQQNEEEKNKEHQNKKEQNKDKKNIELPGGTLQIININN
jgi:glycosyltransferase involved in cell wall biosynthesis